MDSENTKSEKNEGTQDELILEMHVDESETNKYKLIIPLSYGVEFSEVDSQGKNISTSFVQFNGTQTIIKTPLAPAKWKLKIKNLSDRSGTDPIGIAIPPDGDGSGDGWGSDWLMVKQSGLDDKSRQLVQSAVQIVQGAVQTARRTLIIQQEEPTK